MMDDGGSERIAKVERSQTRAFGEGGVEVRRLLESFSSSLSHLETHFLYLYGTLVKCLSGWSKADSLWCHSKMHPFVSGGM